MSWTTEQLANAILALDPAMTTAEQVALLNAQTQTLTQQRFTWREARIAAFAAGTGDFVNIILRARQTPSAMPPVTVEDTAIVCAIAAMYYQLDDVIDPMLNWPQFVGSLSAMVAVGDMSTPCYDNIIALTNKTVLLWDPVVTNSDIDAINQRRTGGF